MSYRSGITRDLATTISILLALFLISGCSDKIDIETGNQTVIRVDGHVLTLSEFNEFFEPHKMNYDQGDEMGLKEARLGFLLQLVEEMIIIRRAEVMGLDISSRDLEDAVNKIKLDYGDETFNEMFMKQAITPEVWKKRLRRQLLAEKVVRKDLGERIHVSSEEIGSFFDEHHEQWKSGEKIRVFQILSSDKRQASKILDRIKKGEDFISLAREYSTAPEAVKGGDMGYLARGHLPQCLEDPIFSLKLNKVSGVVKSPFGYHIFMVVEKKKAVKPSLEDSIERIRERVKNEKIEAAYGPWLAKLRARYKVFVNKEII